MYKLSDDGEQILDLNDNLYASKLIQKQSFKLENANDASGNISGCHFVKVCIEKDIQGNCIRYAKRLVCV